MSKFINAELESNSDSDSDSDELVAKLNVVLILNKIFIIVINSKITQN